MALCLGERAGLINEGKRLPEVAEAGGSLDPARLVLYGPILELACVPGRLFGRERWDATPARCADLLGKCLGHGSALLSFAWAMYAGASQSGYYCNEPAFPRC